MLVAFFHYLNLLKVRMECLLIVAVINTEHNEMRGFKATENMSNRPTDSNTVELCGKEFCVYRQTVEKTLTESYIETILTKQYSNTGIHAD